MITLLRNFPFFRPETLRRLHYRERAIIAFGEKTPVPNVTHHLTLHHHHHHHQVVVVVAQTWSIFLENTLRNPLPTLNRGPSRVHTEREGCASEAEDIAASVVVEGLDESGVISQVLSPASVLSNLSSAEVCSRGAE